MAAPGPDPRKAMGKRKQSKEQSKKLKLYVVLGVVIGLLVLWIASAEMQANESAAWAENYNRKCEACQTMIVSGIWTRSM